MSDLVPSSATNGWGPWERDTSNGESEGGDGKPLTINGTVYPKGLGVHADSEIVYLLDGRCSRFTADIGVDDETGGNGSVVFAVKADAEQLFSSGIVRGGTAPQRVDVDLQGRKELRLIVTNGGDGAAYDHADWAAALLTCNESSGNPSASIRFPADAGVVDLSAAPYNARGDGVTDNTAILQRALNEHPNGRTILYLPNGTYVVSDSLRWPVKDLNGGSVYGFENLQGESTAGAVIRLKDGSFTDVAAPKAVIDMGFHGSADYFANSVRNLTIDTGANNPGASGMKFFSNNQGAVKDVVIRTSASGVTGLDLGYNDQNGPLLVKNVMVIGFANGVSTGYTVNSQVFEHLTLQGQDAVGFTNNGQVITIRDLVSINSVPAVVNKYGVMTLIDASLTGGAAENSAVTNGEILFARNIRTDGYGMAIQNDSGGTASATGPNVDEFVSSPVVSLFSSPPKSLNLPARDTPDVANDDPSTWANVQKFGAAGDGPRGDIQYRGGDGFGYDSANWASAQIVAADGTIRYLAGEFNYFGGTQHTLTSDELGWISASFSYAYPQIDQRYGKPISIRGTTYRRGIATAQPSDYHYALGGKYRTFTTDVGVDDDARGNGSVQFEVFADGKPIYNSGVVYGNTPAKRVSLDVSGVNDLELKVTDGQDDTAGIQAAIDSGATTVYFPRGTYTVSKTVFIRGNVRRLIGTEATVNVLIEDGTPGFRLVDGTSPTVVFERLGSGETRSTFLEHASSRTLVLRDAETGRLKGTGTGDFFLENVVGGAMEFGRQNVWARQLNVENEGTHVLNNGGNLWILGLKTERGGTLIDTQAGGRTELLGGLSYTTTAGKLAPMFVNNESSVSLTIGEVSYTGDPFAVLVKETRGGVTKTLNRGDAPLRYSFLQGSALPLYTGYAPSRHRPRRPGR